jgi:hypothetical protein
MKTCKICQISKEIKEYPVEKKMKDGTRNICRNCTRINHKIFRTKHIEAIRQKDRNNNSTGWRIESQKKYLKTDKGKKSRYNANQKYKEKNKHKIFAQQVAFRAYKKGLIKQRPCQLCGSLDNIQMHHEDYSQPLIVVWLCTQHHKDQHPTKRK